MVSLRAPQPLRPGDTVAVIAPSSCVAGEVQRPRVEGGIARLRSWGLDVVEGKHLWDTHPGIATLAGLDKDRAADVEWAWTDPDVAAVVCARGGYGVQRMLTLLPEGVLARGDGRWLVGFSDVTPLLHRLGLEAGLQGIHGPMAAGLSDGEESGTESLRRVLFGEVGSEPLLTGLSCWNGVGADEDRVGHRGDEGGVTGPLIGGNVAMLAASVGTADLIPSWGAIAFLEDVGQPSFVLDRGLTQLLRSGWFDGVQGVLVGDFSMDSPPQDVDAVLRDRLLPLGVPVWAGGQFGHERLNHALPHGAECVMGGGELHPA